MLVENSRKQSRQKVMRILNELSLSRLPGQAGKLLSTWFYWDFSVGYWYAGFTDRAWRAHLVPTWCLKREKRLCAYQLSDMTRKQLTHIKRTKKQSRTDSHNTLILTTTKIKIQRWCPKWGGPSGRASAVFMCGKQVRPEFRKQNKNKRRNPGVWG